MKISLKNEGKLYFQTIKSNKIIPQIHTKRNIISLQYHRKKGRKERGKEGRKEGARCKKLL
jgi:hypothetical protein